MFCDKESDQGDLNDYDRRIHLYTAATNIAREKGSKPHTIRPLTRNQYAGSDLYIFTIAGHTYTMNKPTR